MPVAAVADGLRIETQPQGVRKLPVRTIGVAAIGVAAVGLAAAVALVQLASGPGLQRLRGVLAGGEEAVPAPAPAVTVTARDKDVVANLSVDDKAQIVAAGEAAAQRNAAIPLAGLPLEKVGGFSVAGATRPAAATNALTCLTQAVYYEAAHEPITGRRAVAQVVLNRMRHPAYPHSVCGVVYQGSERRTGCQFSFTCDGSLLRKPGAAAWAAAQEVARAALAGHVEPSVGTATHYHANYVLPRWAFNLGKITQIGAHIFYRFRGGWGASRAFTGAYSGAEWIPSLDMAALRQRQEMAVALAASEGEVLTDGMSGGAGLAGSRDPRDAGGRVNVTKLWRMKIATPGAAAGEDSGADALGEELKPLPVSNSAASALSGE